MDGIAAEIDKARRHKRLRAFGVSPPRLGTTIARRIALLAARLLWLWVVT